jgi:hypothetical protein
MDNSASPLEKLSYWIYENKNLFNSGQYMHVMRLVADAYRNNNNELLTFDVNRFRIISDSDNENEDDHWSGTDDINDSSSDRSDDESTYTGNYINHY